MRFRVSHETRYAYSEPVRLAPHRFRLAPRHDGTNQVVDHRLVIVPAPAGTRHALDADGNVVLQAWFDGSTRELSISSRFEVLTLRPAAPGELPEPAALPAPYDAPLRSRLAPWIDVDDGGGKAARTLASALAAESADVPDFLRRLNRHLHAAIVRQIRATGAAQTPEQTLQAGRGACRDLAVLFAAVCRRQGLAARFVSGYQKARDGTAPDARRWMHAWPEVYLPATGWRGFDPTHGEPVADAHVALAAAARPEDAAPVEGSYCGAARSTMDASLQIDVQP